MAKRDRDYENRMYGYISAYNKAKKEGIDSLERDIRMRNLLRLDIKVPEKRIREDYDLIAKRTVTNIMAAALWVLHDSCQFGSIRLARFKNNLENLVRDISDLDYLGQHYVKLEDFAIELNEKYNLGIDVDCIAACGDVSDRRDKNYRMCRIDEVLKGLKENGFSEAACFIEKNLYE